MRLPGRRRSRKAKPAASPRDDTADDGAPAEEAGPGHHSADAPVDNPRDDELGREEFAKSLAVDVRLAPPASGFVIGLSGPWGSGKTSILKLAAYELRDDVSAVVTFNPWLFAGAEQLVTHFFAELAGQLEQRGSDQLVQQIADGLSKYGRLVSPLRYAPLVGGIAGLASEAAKSLGDSLQSEELSAELQAEEISADLLRLNKPILVLVDDLDRLRPEEIVDVVRLIRLVGDFPNLVYIVAFDQGIVESALGSDRSEGQAYLEKIIHVLHAVPAARHEDLTRVLGDALGEAVPDPKALRFDEQRFRSLFWEDVRPFFRTVRDVRRFINTVRSSVELLGDEVDLADLMTLEALRLFEPDSFAEVVKARYLLTGSSDPLDRGYARLFADKSKAADAEQVKSIVEASSDSHRVEEIIKNLFPLAEKHFGGAHYTDRGFRSEWRTQARVASADVLDIYLSRRLAPGTLPTRQVESMLESFSNKEELATKLHALDDDALRGLYIRLADYEGDWSPEQLGNVIEVVMHRGVGFGDTFSDSSGAFLLRGLLRSAPTGEIPGILRGLSYPDRSHQFELLRTVAYRSERQSRTVSDEDAAALEQEFRTQILAGNGVDLLGERDFGPLTGYLESKDRERLVDRLPEWLADRAFLLKFVAAHSFLRVGERNSRSVQLDWPTLSDVLDAANCRELIRKVDAAWVKANFDGDTQELWQQARRYMDDPEAAAQDLAGWPGHDDQDD
jgi:predicted KAP-like P-loop ATPase